jgi:hypothetical protein
LRAWARSSLQLSTQIRESPLASEAGSSEITVAVQGRNDVLLSSTFMRVVSTTDAQSRLEGVRVHRLLRARPSRRTARQETHLNSEAEPSGVLNASLNDTVRLRASRQGATAVRIIAEAYGETAQGERFGRIFNQSHLRLEPLSTWEPARAEGGTSVVIRARITSAEYANGHVVALRLARADAHALVEKTVQPASGLGEAMALIDLNKLDGQVLWFRVQQSQALRLLYPLEPQT